MSLLLVLGIGIVVGIVMGLTGAGGGILAVPALAESMGWSMQQAMPVALTAVTGAAALGTLEGLRKKLVRYRAAILMALVGMPLTSLGVLLANRLPQTWLMAAFAAILLLVAVRIFSADANLSSTLQTHTLVRVNSETGRFDWSTGTALVIAAIGGIAGLVTGLLGVGGGFIIVPMLRRYTNISMHGAIATSLLVIALVGAAGVASAVSQGADLPLRFTAYFVASTALGMLGGRRIARHVSDKAVQNGFATLLIVVADILILRALA